jgi:hypothetical protein
MENHIKLVSELIETEQTEVSKDLLSVITLYNSGLENYLNDNFTAALGHFENLLQINPNYGPALVGRVHVLWQMDLVSHAAVAFLGCPGKVSSRFVEIPRNIDLQLLYGMCQYS